MRSTIHEVDTNMQFNRKSAKGTAILGLFVALLAFAMTQGAIAESAKDNAAEPNADAINELSKAFGSRAEEITESPLTDFFMVELQNGADRLPRRPTASLHSTVTCTAGPTKKSST